MIDLDEYLTTLQSHKTNITKTIKYLEGIILDQSSPPPHKIFTTNNISIPLSKHNLYK